MSDSDACGAGISQWCTTESNNGDPWLAAEYPWKPEMLHSPDPTRVWLCSCPWQPGHSSANGFYTREIWIYDKRESSSNPEGRAWNLLCVNIQPWPVCTAESVDSNNSHPCFYSSPACLCTCFLSTRELVPKFSIHLCGWCPPWPLCAASRGQCVGPQSAECHPRYKWGREEGCSLHFKSWKHILRALLLSVL